MNIALLPRNIGSDINYRVKALNEIGLNAKGFNFQTSNIISSENLNILPQVVNVFNPLDRVRNTIEYIKILTRIVNWADIVHWVYDLTYIPFTDISLEFRILRNANKPGVIQWCGSDIRNYKIDREINPYFKKAYDSGEWVYNESDIQSNRCQFNFSKLSYMPLEFIGMGHYIKPDLFPKRYRIFQLLGSEDIIPNIPKLSNKPFKIVHSPSSRGVKGTKYIIEAINALKLKYEIDFVLLENLPRFEALRIVAECDIFIDQLIAGSHGSAAVEAMSFGKPVICYINEVIGKDYPSDLPIINANPDTIYSVLFTLLENRYTLNKIGENSRKYVEKYHFSKVNAFMQKRYYEETIDFHKNL